MKNQEVAQREDDEECGICLMALQRPVKCKGSCARRFCLDCVSKTKYTSNRCPNRCSTPFEVEVVPESMVRFVCPFDSNRCSLLISTRIELKDHASVCPLATAASKEALAFRQNYACQCGEKLTFLDHKSFKVIYGEDCYVWALQETCSTCNEPSICRSICLACSNREARRVYCFDCRPPPCSKTLCPLGHRLKHKKKVGKMRFCDVCDAPAYIIGQDAYGYCPCDFDLCLSCFNSMPDQNSMIPLKLASVRSLMKVARIQDESSGSEWMQAEDSDYEME